MARQVLFEKKVVDFILENNVIKGVKTADGNFFEADAVILATGHSARDIFHLLHHKKIRIEFKPFALGVRIEHPQTLIDQYSISCRPATHLIKASAASEKNYLPPSAYSLGGTG